MTKFFITRYQWVSNNKGERTKKFFSAPCKTNLLPSHKAVKYER